MDDFRTVTALVGMGERYLGRAGPFDVRDPWWSHVEPVTGRLDELLGVPTAVVRLLAASATEAVRGGSVTYHVEVPEAPRPGVLDASPAPEWPGVLAGHPLRAAWATPAGPRELVGWAARALGAPLVGRPVQVKTWNLSCLHRLSTMDELVWVKATARFGCHEAASIRLVREHDPGLAPEVLADEPARHLVLMRHAPGTDCWEAAVDDVCAAVRRWVPAQASIASAVALSAGGVGGSPVDGVADRRPESLLDDLPRLLDRGTLVQLDGGELAAVEAVVRRLPELIDELESSGLPPTLVHGDLNGGNLITDGTRQTIVDWAESHWGHPAFDLMVMLRYVPADGRAAVEAAWVDAWRDQLPASDPKRAVRPMSVLAYLLNAVLYQRFLDNIEPAERVYHEGDPARELRRAIALR